MRSQRQIEDSRANGARSRGPVTVEGKSRSSRNALKHGMLADAIVLECESDSRFPELLAELHEEFNPQTHTEEDFVETMVACGWRLWRLWSMETANLDLEINKQDRASTTAGCAALAFRTLGDQSRSLDLINRCETRYDRQYSRTLARLLDIQSRRPPITPAFPKPINSNFPNEPKQPKPEHPELAQVNFPNEPKQPKPEHPELAQVNFPNEPEQPKPEHPELAHVNFPNEPKPAHDVAALTWAGTVVPCRVPSPGLQSPVCHPDADVKVAVNASQPGDLTMEARQVPSSVELVVAAAALNRSTESPDTSPRPGPSASTSPASHHAAPSPAFTGFLKTPENPQTQKCLNSLTPARPLDIFPPYRSVLL